MFGQFLATYGVTLLSALIAFYARFSRLEAKVDVMWDFLRRRGNAEVRNLGLVSPEPRIVPTPTARDAYAPLVTDLRRWWVKRGHKLGERDLWREIEHEFGERLSREVCPSLGPSDGGCITLAIAIMRDGSPK